MCECITTDPQVPVTPIKTLTWLSVEGEDEDEFSEFVKAHAATLETLICSDMFLNEYITFPRVKHLSCWNLPYASFPLLESLAIEGMTRPDNFSNLPHSRITGVDLYFELVTAAEIDEIMNQIGKMINLKKMTIGGNFCLSAEMFVSIHHLEEVDIQFGLWGSDSVFKDAGTFVSSLVQNNPLISTLIVSGIPVKDEDLISCAALTNLNEVRVMKIPGEKFTAAGVRALLSGASRQNISNFFIEMSDEMYNEISAEFSEFQRFTS